MNWTTEGVTPLVDHGNNGGESSYHENNIIGNAYLSFIVKILIDFLWLLSLINYYSKCRCI